MSELSSLEDRLKLIESFTVYRAGTEVFLDFHPPSSKPRAQVVEVIEDCDGRFNSWRDSIRVKLREPWAGLEVGTIISTNAYRAVPCKQEISPQRGEYFRRLNTHYRYEKSKL